MDGLPYINSPFELESVIMSLFFSMSARKRCSLIAICTSISWCFFVCSNSSSANEIFLVTSNNSSISSLSKKFVSKANKLKLPIIVSPFFIGIIRPELMFCALANGFQFSNSNSF